MCNNLCVAIDVNLPDMIEQFVPRTRQEVEAAIQKLDKEFRFKREEFIDYSTLTDSEKGARNLKALNRFKESLNALALGRGPRDLIGAKAGRTFSEYLMLQAKDHKIKMVLDAVRDVLPSRTDQQHREAEDFITGFTGEIAAGRIMLAGLSELKGMEEELEMILWSAGDIDERTGIDYIVSMSSKKHPGMRSDLLISVKTMMIELQAKMIDQESKEFYTGHNELYVPLVNLIDPVSFRRYQDTVLSSGYKSEVFDPRIKPRLENTQRVAQEMEESNGQRDRTHDQRDKIVEAFFMALPEPAGRKTAGAIDIAGRPDEALSKAFAEYLLDQPALTRLL